MLEKLKIYLILLCVIFLNKILASHVDDDSADYKLVLDKLTKEIEDVEIVETNISFDISDTEVKISGEMKQLIDLDNNAMINLTIFHSKKKDGKYKKKIAFIMGVCDLMKTTYKKYLYTSLKNYSNAPDPDICPVTKETYLIKDYPLDSSKFKKFLKMGFYKIECEMIINDKTVVRYIFDGHVEEEKK